VRVLVAETGEEVEMSIADARLLVTTCTSLDVMYFTDPDGLVCGHVPGFARRGGRIHKAMKLYNFVTGREQVTPARLRRWLKGHHKQINYMLWELSLDEFTEFSEYEDIKKELADVKYYLNAAEDRRVLEVGELQRRVDELEGM
jgi:hypothetical protein